MTWSRRFSAAFFALAMLPVAIVHLSLFQNTEPFYNNDETRHLMTGVFFRDFILSGQYLHPKQFATAYYLQYPALGLLVWPPGFHFTEGVWFLIWGSSYLASRVLVELFFVLSSFYLFRLVKRTHGQPMAMGTVALFGMMPIVVPFSRQIMLEIPTLAWVLASIFHFERYLEKLSRKDAWLACLFAAFAALTRFDGVMLLPFVVGRLLMRQQFYVLKDRHVIGGILLASLLTIPYYFITWKEYGGAVAAAATQGTGADSTGLLSLRNIVYYPSALPFQMSWFLCVPAWVGFARSWLPYRLSPPGVYQMLIVAVYVTFSPLAELEERHAIYWLPAWTLFSISGFFWLMTAVPSLSERLKAIALGGTIMVVGLLWETCRLPNHFVFGYAEAAAYVVEHAKGKRVLIDAFLNGGFIYDVYSFDKAHRLTVLRGDKLFYGMLSDPHGGYEEHVKGTAEVAKMIYDLDPEYIVIEQPVLYFKEMPGAILVRETIAKYPERFELVKAIDIRTNRKIFQGASLEIYRNIFRNPNPIENIAVPMLNLGKELKKEE